MKRCRPYFFFVLLLSHYCGLSQSNLSYVKNNGQWDKQILYKSRFRGGSIFIEKNTFTYVFHPAAGIDHHDFNDTDSIPVNYHAIKMEFENAMSSVDVTGSEKQSAYHNYYLGQDQSKWAGKVPLYKAVDHKNLYNGISVKTFSHYNDVRFDLTVAPHADPAQIVLLFKGQDRLSLHNNELVMATSLGDIVQQAPQAWQEINGQLKKVICQYKLSKDRVTFELGKYNTSYPLIIDPTLVFASYTGSTADNFGMTATYDNQGNTYAGGICYADGYPVTTGAYQIMYNPSTSNPFDMTLTKFSEDGSSLLFSTYVGGKSVETPQSIIVDSHNNLLVLGSTNSIDFPVTTSCFDNTHNGFYDAVVLKMKSDGTQLLASTYLGGESDDGKNVSPSLKFNYADDLRGGILVDVTDNVYITTCTKSIGFPITGGAAQSTKGAMQDACVVKLDQNLNSLIYATYLGGDNDDAGYNIALDENNCIYVAGGTLSTNFPVTAGVLKNSMNSGDLDGFITHLSANGQSFLHSSFVGTSGRDQSHFVEVDKNGRVYVFGQTYGTYPVTSGVYANPGSGQYIHCMDPALSSTFFSTVIGKGSIGPDISPAAFLVDNCNNIYISGWGGLLNNQGTHVSSTTGLPVSSDAFQSTTDGNDFYFMQLSENAQSMLYATFFGGGLSKEHVDGGTSRFDKTGAIYQAICAGCGAHSDLPTTPGVWSPTNNSWNCNNAVVKFSFNTEITSALFNTSPQIPAGCVPLMIGFNNESLHAVHYQWTFGDGATSTDIHPVHTYTTPGNYLVMLIATDSSTCNIVDTAFFPITVFPDVDIQLQSPLHVCADSSVQLNAIVTGTGTISWNPATYLDNASVADPVSTPPADITYTIRADNGACADEDSVSVFVHRNNSFIVMDVAQQCSSNPTIMAADSMYSTYLWSTGATSQQISVFLPGTYTLTTTDLFGCIGSDTASISNYTNIDVMAGDTGMCEGQSVQLATTEGNYVYNWAPAATLNDAHVFNPVASPPASTSYTITIINGPCVTSNTITVNILPLPIVNAEPVSITVLPGENADMMAIADTTVFWSPPRNLLCDVCFATSALPDSTITYYATVYNKYGCSVTDSVQVFVSPVLYIPNAFSPNSDQKNNIFKPEHQGIVKMEFMIFNRWGEQLFKTEELNGGWDGTYKGHRCQQDVYVYKLIATDYLDNVIEKEGTVTLIR